MGKPTVGKIGKRAAAWDAVMGNMKAARSTIDELKAKHEGLDWEGEMECPECGEPMHVEIFAKTRRILGKCEAPDCLLWFME